MTTSIRAEHLQDRARRHLADHPGTLLSAYEITRALGLGATRVRGVKGALARLTATGEVEAVTTRKSATDDRPITRWRIAAGGAKDRG